MHPTAYHDPPQRDDESFQKNQGTPKTIPTFSTVRWDDCLVRLSFANLRH